MTSADWNLTMVRSREARLLLPQGPLGVDWSDIRVAHLDTGYDPEHKALPAGLDLPAIVERAAPAVDCSRMRVGQFEDNGLCTKLSLSSLSVRSPPLRSPAAIFRRQRLN